MNRIYRVLFNRCLGVWQAVCESATGHSKSSTSTAKSASRTAPLTAPVVLVLGALSASMAFAHVTIGDPNDPTQQTDVSGGLTGSNSGSWNANGPLTVGITTEGMLTIDHGIQVTNTIGVVGDNAGSNGVVNLKDAGTRWTNSGTLYVGYGGNGTLNLASGTIVRSDNAFIGQRANSVGVVNVSGTNAQWINAGQLIVGDYGSGTLNIQNGGVVTNTNGYVGNVAGSTGAATVSGIGSQWNNSGKFFVGQNGNGTLNIEAGGTVNATNSTIGNNANGTGTATVSGAGSAWSSTGTLTVGNGGKGTLNVQDAGKVDSINGSVGNAVGSDGTVTVNGQASVWRNLKDLTVGDLGNGTLNVQNGGRVISSHSVVGNAAGGVGHVDVSGANSIWHNSDDLVIGNAGNGSLNIADGGIVISSNSSVGASVGGTGQVTVDGAKSIWYDTGSLHIGSQGTGTLTIANGARVTASSVHMGQDASGSATINLHGNAIDGRSELATGQITKGDGSATLNLDGGVLRATADQADFLSGFDTLELGAGGAVIDTDQHDIGINTQLTSAQGQNSGLIKQGHGTLTLGQHNTYTGTTVVEQGTLQAGANNVLSSASVHTVNRGTSLDLAGFDQTIAGLNNSGTVNLSGSTPGTTLTVTGNYVGDEGHMGISTELNGSNSASDRLVLSGPNTVASGHTTLHVTNAGGLGAQTTGNGIQVIATENGATLGQDSFTLAGGHVDAGAFEYHLIQNSQGASLHSYDTQLAYREEVPLISALPAQLQQSDLAMLGDMRKRMGDGVAQREGDSGRRVWGRVLRTDPKIRQQGTVNPESTGHLTGFQAGLDLYADQNLKAGFYVGQMEGDMSVSGFASGVDRKHVGFNNLRSRYLGVYGTWQNASGLYADAVLQGADYRSRLNTASTGQQASVSGNSWLASLEVGQSFALNSSWQVEPQAQLVYRKMNLDDTVLRLSDVKNHTKGDWTMRLGARIKGSFATSAGLLQPYGRFSIQASNSTTNVASFIVPAATTDISVKNGYTSTELAAGTSLQLNPRTSLYGELNKVFSAGGNTRLSSGLQASAGVRVLW